MNDAIPVGSEGLLTTAQLAARADFMLGAATVSPSARTVTGPGGRADLEPRVMQVLVILADVAGQVVTRETLFERCWGGVVVGDDSLNRAIAAVRKIADGTAAGTFEIETIPRTGYRLKCSPASSDPPAPTTSLHSSRRALIVGGAAIAAAGIGGYLWLSSRDEFDELMARGDAAFRDGSAYESMAMGGKSTQPLTALYDRAVQLRPDSARAWGLLAYWRTAKADDAPAEDGDKAIASAGEAIRRALELDPRETNARVAMFRLEGPMHDWATRDRQLRSILASESTSIPAMMELMPLLQAAGLTRESWYWNERVLRLSPLMRACLVVRGLKLWIMGKVREADSVINRVIGLWPDYAFGNYARFNILLTTGRPRAARDILLHSKSLAAEGTRRLILDALEFRTPAALDAARTACLKTGRDSPPLANDMIMYLCTLGLKEDAFDLTEGFLLWRGKMISDGNGKQVDVYNRRMTQWLFTPPLGAMRADSRFDKLCDEFGLTDYWRARGVQPDYLRYA